MSNLKNSTACWPPAEPPELLVVHDQLVSLLRHLPLYVHHPLEPRVQVDGQLLLRLGAPLADGEDVLVVPHHHLSTHIIIITITTRAHTCPGDLSTSIWVSRDNSYFPHYYSHSRWRIYMPRKISFANYCTVAKISGEFANMGKWNKWSPIFMPNQIIHTGE